MKLESWKDLKPEEKNLKSVKNLKSQRVIVGFLLIKLRQKHENNNDKWFNAFAFYSKIRGPWAMACSRELNSNYKYADASQHISNPDIATNERTIILSRSWFWRRKCFFFFFFLIFTISGHDSQWSVTIRISPPSQFSTDMKFWQKLAEDLLSLLELYIFPTLILPWKPNKIATGH